MIVGKAAAGILFGMESAELEQKLALDVYLYMADSTRIAMGY